MGGQGNTGATTLALGRSAGFSVVPIRGRAGFIHAFLQPVRGYFTATKPRVAWLNQVLLAQIQRVHTQLFCDLIQLGFPCKGDLWIAKSPESAKAQLVGIDQLAMCFRIGNAIGAKAHQ